ncbi:LytR family transcriptional regulator [Lysinibacillus yapensis]|uniref:Regulatory protein MsrR n=1 Tax=Ureibacillus yapensis TaxID=2304605 RepID=A0A396SCV5_9BACL|nr:LCP family protein [Lysinibacillus yapensis]RHW37547.1 LytR family transcriptional regulator [Lysinibacillus yapensis]
MEENRKHQTRSTRRKKRKLRKGRLFFTLLVLFVMIAGIYSIVQYRSGLKQAEQGKLPQQEFVADEAHDTIKNYLIIGVDSRGEENSRSDTMMVLSWNQDKNDLKLVSFMRDIYADIPGYQSYKLNTAYYLGGVQLLKDTLNNMFDIPIHHYALVDFKSFESLIDILAPNGIEMEVEKDMSANIDVTLTKGVHKLNGKELLGYARFRHDEEGDFGRVQRQQKVIDALKNEILNPMNFINLPKFIGAAQGYITTDLTTGEELKTVLSLAVGGQVEIEKMAIPVEGSYSYQSYPHAGEVIEIDVEYNKQQLHNFLDLNGE